MKLEANICSGDSRWPNTLLVVRWFNVVKQPKSRTFLSDLYLRFSSWLCDYDNFFFPQRFECSKSLNEVLLKDISASNTGEFNEKTTRWLPALDSPTGQNLCLRTRQRCGIAIGYVRRCRNARGWFQLASGPMSSKLQLICTSLMHNDQFTIYHPGGEMYLYAIRAERDQLLSKVYRRIETHSCNEISHTEHGLNPE